MDEKSFLIEVDDQVCNVYIEGKVIHYMFYSLEGKFEDYKLEVYE